MEIDSRIIFVALFHQMIIYVNMHPDIDCDFTNGTCGWKNVNGQWSTGEYNESYYSPKTQGSYAYVDAGEITFWNLACLQSGLINSNVTGYINFSYYMHTYGKKRDALNIYLVTNSSVRKLVWAMIGNQGNKWGNGSVFIYEKDDYEIVIEAIHDTSIGKGLIALDNVHFGRGEWRVNCNFEYGFCGWRQPVDFGDSYWTRENYSEHGFSLRLESWDGRAHKARLESLPVEYIRMQCFAFYIKTKHNSAQSSYSGLLNVTLDSGGLWNLSVQMHEGNNDDKWQKVLVHIGYPNAHKDFRIIVTASVTRNDSIYLDNMQLLNSSCLDCDYEDQPCGWLTHTPLRSSVNTVNGTTDIWRGHAYGNDKGHFLVLGGNSDFVYESIHFYIEDFQCLRFRYLVIGKFHAKIEVSMQVAEKANQSLKTFSNSHEERNTWIGANAEIQVTNKVMVKIYLHGQTDSDTYLGLDDIVITPGSCLELTTRPTTTTFSTIPATDNTTKVTARTVTTLTDFASVSLGTIIGIVIGCLTLTITVSLVAVYIYRRKSASSAFSSTLRSSTVANGSYSVASTTESDNQNFSRSTQRKKCMTEIGYYNAQAEYDTVEKTRPRQSQKPHRSGQGNTKGYSLADQLPDKSGSNVTNPGQTQRLRNHSGNSERNNPNDISYDTKETLPHITYNHTKEFDNDTYDSTIPGTKVKLDETYNHTNFKTTLDNTYDRTDFTVDNTYKTTIRSRNHDDSNSTYDHTSNVGNNYAYETTNTRRNSVDDTYDNTS